MLKRIVLVVTVMVLAGFTLDSSTVRAEAQKIGVMNPQRVILESAAGRKAAEVVKKRGGELQKQFTAEQEALIALQQEIEKKSSAWSKDKTGEKVRELKIGQRELQVKTEDAQMEIRQLEAKEMEPIFKMLQTVLNSYGQKNGFSVIIDAKMAVLYADPSIDVSDEIKKELDKRLK